MTQTPRRAPPEVLLFLGALALRLAHYALNRGDFWFRTPLLDDNLFLSQADVIVREGWKAPGLGTFYLNPAYPYLLAALKATVGAGPAVVYGLQHLVGAAVPVILYRLAKRLFDERAALIAGALAAAYGPSLFFASRYLGESIIFAASTAFLALLFLAREPQHWALAGLCLGVSAVLRPTALALMPLAAAAALQRRPEPKPLALSAAAFLAALWLPLLPFQLRNRAVDPAAGWGLTTASGGINLYIGNNPEADGLNKYPSFCHGGPGHQYQDFIAEAERISGGKMTSKEVDRYWLSRARTWFAARPRDAWRLVARKAGYFWNHREPPDNFFSSIFKRFTRLGPLPLPGWALVAPLGLTGLLWSLPRLRELWPLHAFTLVYLALNAGFFVLSRYRFPAAAALIPAGAFAAAEGWRLSESKRWPRLLALLALLGGSLWLTRLPLIGEEDEAVSRYSMGVIYANQGWRDEAAAEYREAVRLNPGFGPAWVNLGLLELQRGNREAAVSALEAALALETDPERAGRIRGALSQLKGRK